MTENVETTILLNIISVLRETEEKFTKEADEQTRPDLILGYGMAGYIIRSLKTSLEDKLYKAKLANLQEPNRSDV